MQLKARDYYEKNRTLNILWRKFIVLPMINDKKIITPLEGLQVYVSEDDWKFMCEHRFFSDSPSQEEIRSEFITGTGITKSKTEIWSQASERFADYIKDLRELNSLDINTMAKEALTIVNL